MSLHTPRPWDAVAEGYAETTLQITQAFARAALDWVAPSQDAHILDLATGPGTLSKLALAEVAQITAVDFSPEMLRICRAQLAGTTVEILEADGQDLGIHQRFDAAFSMFGLIFFPDRDAALRSLRASLRPGGVACISSWLPPQRSSGMIQAMGAFSAALPDWTPGELERPDWDHPEIIAQAMERAGFHDLQIEERLISVDVDAESAWRGLAQGFAPLALARQTMDPRLWAEAEQRGQAWMAEHCEPTQSYAALFAKGRA